MAKSRICFSNESKDEERKIWYYDGEKLKKVLSEGDEIEGRQIRKEAEEVEAHTFAVMFSNEYIEFKPYDSMKYAIFFEFPCYFETTKSSEYELKGYIRRDPIKGVKNWPKELENKKAFCYYTLKMLQNVDYSEIIKESEEYSEELISTKETPEDKVSKVLEITKNKDDFLSIKEIKKIADENSINYRAIKEILGKVAKQHRTERERGWIYVKRKTLNFNDFV